MNYNKLTPQEEYVLLRKGTDAPYTGEYTEKKDTGMYICRRCNAPLYLSKDKFDSHCFAGKVEFKGYVYKNEGIADIIQTFQEAHDSFSVEQFQIQDVKFDLVKERADIQAWIRYRSRGNGNRYFEGSCKITFLYQWGYWYIDGFRLPGFGD